MAEASLARHGQKIYNNTVDNLISKRTHDAYPRNVITAIKYVSCNRSKLDKEFTIDYGGAPYGSSIYRVQKYPGDIDVHEQVIEESLEKTIKKVADFLQDRVRMILEVKSHWLTEIKAGVDDRFDVSAGTLRDGVYTIDQVEYDGLQKVYNYLSKTDREIFDGIVNNTGRTQEDYTTLSELFRNLKILRWDAEEILAGEKTHHGRRFTLTSALLAHGAVKMDMVTILNNIFIEVTNFLYLGYRPKEIDSTPNDAHEIIPINTKFNFDNPAEGRKEYIKTMKGEIEKLFYAKEFSGYFKGAKRMWAFSRFNYLNGEESFADAIEDLTPLISGEISAIYQIKSTLSSYKLVDSMFELSNIKSELGAFFTQVKKMLSDIMLFTEQQLDEFYKLIDDGRVKDLIARLKHIIEAYTISELKKIGYYPIQARFLPAARMYVKDPPK